MCETSFGSGEQSSTPSSSALSELGKGKSMLLDTMVAEAGRRSGVVPSLRREDWPCYI